MTALWTAIYAVSLACQVAAVVAAHRVLARAGRRRLHAAVLAGLGLMVVRRAIGTVAAAHGPTWSEPGEAVVSLATSVLALVVVGQVAAATEGVGRGATFAVPLPVAWRPIAADLDVAAVADPGDPPDPAAVLAGVRVLVVDPDPAARAVTARSLRAAGATIVEAGDGSAALARLADGPADVILGEVDLPDMGGAEFLRRVRALSPTLDPAHNCDGDGRWVPAVALSGDRAVALAAGYQAHLNKGGDPPDLVAAVVAMVSVGDGPAPRGDRP